MTLHWTDFPDAPAAGTPICTLKDVQMGVSAHLIGDFPMLIVHDNAGIRAFVNACPHQFLPLNARGDVLGADGTRLICTNHDAVFDALSGQGVSGHGLNCALSPIPIDVTQAHVRIAISP